MDKLKKINIAGIIVISKAKNCLNTTQKVVVEFSGVVLNYKGSR